MNKNNFVTFELHVDQLEPHPKNPRKNLGDLTELTESIKKNGVLQNLTVVPIDTGDDEWDRFRVLIGHRRLAAAKAAGIDTLPCRVAQGLDEREQFFAMMEENMQRNDLTIWEQAEGFQMMLDLGDGISQIASKTGFSETTIRHRLKIAELGEDVVRKLTEDEESGFQLTIGDFIRLEQVESAEDRCKILAKSRSRDSMEFEVNQYLRKKMIEGRSRRITAELTELGLRKAPKDAEEGRWSGRWIQLDSYQLQFDSEPQIDKEILLAAHKPEELFFFENWSTIYIVAKNKDAEKADKEREKQKTEEDLREINTKKLEEIADAEDARRKSYIRDILKGKVLYKADANTAERERLITSLVQLVINADLHINRDKAIEVIAGQRHWQMEREDRKKSRAKLDELPTELQLLCMVDGSLPKLDTLVSYDASWSDNDDIIDYYDLLGDYFSYNIDGSEEYRIIEGTHELYMDPLHWDDEDEDRDEEDDDE